MIKRIACIVALLLSAMVAASCNSSVEYNAEPEVVFVTTPAKVVREMLKLAAVSRDDTVYDLGSGDGRIVIAAAKDFGARGVGIDINPELIAQSRKNALKEGVSERVSFVQKDVLEADIRPATVIALYMLPSMNKQLLSKFYRELKPGARVVSHRFLIGDWNPDMTLKAYDTMIYLWIVPADVHGNWRITMWNDSDRREYMLFLQQTHQELQGRLTNDQRNFRVTATRLYGTEMSISVADTINGRRFLVELNGSMKGEMLEGTASVTDAGHPLPVRYAWKGVRQ